MNTIILYKLSQEWCAHFISTFTHIQIQQILYIYGISMYIFLYQYRIQSSLSTFKFKNEHFRNKKTVQIILIKQLDTTKKTCIGNTPAIVGMNLKTTSFCALHKTRNSFYFFKLNFNPFWEQNFSIRRVALEIIL